MLSPTERVRQITRIIVTLSICTAALIYSGRFSQRQIIIIHLSLDVAGALVILQPHPRRVLGLITYGCLSLLVCQFFYWMHGNVLWGWLSVSVGLIFLPFLSWRYTLRPLRLWEMGITIFVTATGIAAILLCVMRIPAWSLLLVAGVGTLLCCWLLFMITLEVTLEWLLFFPHRIRSCGPGRHQIPREGPVLVIANHSSYFDPFWLGKIVPRRFTPMMTSAFYDLPVIRWLMRKIVRAIRVEMTRFRREAPEIQEGIEVLKNGGCLMIFPEGILRRKEEPLLRQFGQGVWHILNEVPDTLVIVCWIEGGWGSYLSYKDGPPTRNKKPDFWHHLRIAVQEPEVISGEYLVDHRTTRKYLMRRCLEARAHLGLEVPSENLTEVPEEEEG